MKKPIKFVGLALCSLSITITGNTPAASSRELSGFTEEQTLESNTRVKDCRLFFVKNNLGLQQASMDAGEPVSTLHLFVTGNDDRIIKNAQVITNLIGEDGSQQLARALPFKGGYLLAIDHLCSGEYVVEAEVIAKGEFMTDTFRFEKA